MKRTLMLIAIATLTVVGQRIATQTPDRNRVTRLGTTQDHLSVIELGEPVTQVAAGSSSFKIEWRENKVFIQPLEPGATTNLFIWTASGRLSYELVPAASVEQMHFAIDQAPSTVQAKTPEPVEHPPVVEQPKIPPAMLMESSPVKVVGSSRNHEKVEILMQDVYQKDSRVYLRYAIVNGGRKCERDSGVVAMADDRQVTTEDVLEAVRRRRALCDGVAVDVPVTAGKVLAAFEARMEQRQDLGVVNRALNVFLEPRNPFEP